MDLALTEEQSQLKSTVRDFLFSFCSKEWLDALEETESYPFDLFEQYAQMGLLGLGVPEEYGGSGGGMFDVALVAEQMGHFGGSVNMTYFPTAVFGNQTLLGGASEEMKHAFLPEMAAGNLRTAFALTEPEAGSDAGAIRTRAVRDSGDWVIDGSKIFSTGAHVADQLVLTARTGSADSTSHSLTVFMVDADSPGITVQGIPKLGHNAVKTCEVGLSEVRVPDARVVGDVGGGWQTLVNALDAERIGVAALCVGLAQRCTDMSLAYGQEREQFGQPIASFQAISHMLAEMETETAAGRWLAYESAWRKDHQLPCSKGASMAKAYATELATRTATRGMQVLGGYSYTKEYEMERFYREAKLYEVAGGSTQIQRNIIARAMGIK